MTFVPGQAGSSSAAIVVLSQHGITSDATSGVGCGATAPSGATGQEAAINAVLAAAVANAAALGVSGVKIVWDVAVALGGPVYVYSNMTIEAPSPACGAIMRAATNCAILRLHGMETLPAYSTAPNATPSTANQNWFGKLDPAGGGDQRKRVFDPAYVNARNVAVLGGTWNGNATAQTVGQAQGSYGFNTGFQFFGIDGLLLRGVCVLQTMTYAIHIANWRNLVVENCDVDNDGWSGSSNTDGLHVNGPGTLARVRNLRAHASDDCLAFNADDGQNTMYPWSGPITDVDVDDVLLWNGRSGNANFSGVRLLSTVARLDNVSIRNVRGVFAGQGLMIDAYPPSALSGPGNFGRVIYDNITADGTVNGGYGTGLFQVNGAIETLEIVNRYRCGASAVPDLDIQAAGSVKQLRMDGRWYMPAAATYAPFGQNNEPIVRVEGSVGRLQVTGATYRDATVAVGAAPAVRTMAGSSVGLIDVSMDASGVTNMVDLQAGTVGSVRLSGSHRGAGGGTPLNLAGGVTLKNFVCSGLMYDHNNVAAYGGGGSITNPADYNESVAVTYATAYTTTRSATTGVTGYPVTMTYTPTGGSWPVGTVLTLVASGVAGTWAPTTLSPSGGSAVTATWTPTAPNTGTASLDSTNNAGLTDTTGALAYGVQAASAFLLDNLTVPVKAAYGLHKLRSAYAGSAIRVRRSSDNATQDIGFVSGAFDTASLLSFVGSGDGFVATWYDHSTFGQDLAQPVAANQPQIVASGVVLTLGNSTAKPAVRFKASAQNYLTGNFAMGAPTSFGSASVLSRTTAINGYARGLAFVASGDSNDYGTLTSVALLIYQGSLGANRQSTGGYPTATLGTNPAQVLEYVSGTTATISVDGAATSGAVTGGALGSSGALWMGTTNSHAAGAEFWDGMFAEHMVLGGAPSSTDQNAIRTWQQGYYGTP